MLEQIAGRFKIVAETRGSPVWVNIYTKGGYETWDHLRQMEVSDVHDLRYCLDRLLARLPA